MSSRETVFQTRLLDVWTDPIQHSNLFKTIALLAFSSIWEVGPALSISKACWTIIRSNWPIHNLIDLMPVVARIHIGVLGNCQLSKFQTSSSLILRKCHRSAAHRLQGRRLRISLVGPLLWPLSHQEFVFWTCCRHFLRTVLNVPSPASVTNPHWLCWWKTYRRSW